MKLKINEQMGEQREDKQKIQWDKRKQWVDKGKDSLKQQRKKEGTDGSIEVAINKKKESEQIEETKVANKGAKKGETEGSIKGKKEADIKVAKEGKN